MALTLRERVSLRLRRKLLKNRLVRESNEVVRKIAGENRADLSVLFLCYGNICRSPIAERLALKHFPKGTKISSAGFHQKTERESPENIRVCAPKLGLDVADHRSKRVTEAAIDSADVIVVMDLKNRDDLLCAYPSARSKTVFLGALLQPAILEIRDPYDHDHETTMSILSQIDEAVRRFSEIMFSKHSHSQDIVHNS